MKLLRILFRRFKRWIKTLLGIGLNGGLDPGMGTFAVILSEDPPYVKWIPNPKNMEESMEILNCERISVFEIGTVRPSLYMILIFDSDGEDVKDPLVSHYNKFSHETEVICSKRKCLLCGLLKSEEKGLSWNLHGFYHNLLDIHTYEQIPSERWKEFVTVLKG